MTGIVHMAIADTFDEWAVLRPTWFMQNVIGSHAHAISVRATSAIATSAGSGRAGFVGAGDIAQVAVETLLAPAAVNTDLILTGPESLSYNDVAAILTETSGHMITHKRLDPAGQPAYYEALGVPEFTARFLVGMDWVIPSGAEDRIRADVVPGIPELPAGTRPVHRPAHRYSHPGPRGLDGPRATLLHPHRPARKPDHNAGVDSCTPAPGNP
jgi:hypothetical protein